MKLKTVYEAHGLGEGGDYRCMQLLLIEIIVAFTGIMVHYICNEFEIVQNVRKSWTDWIG